MGQKSIIPKTPRNPTQRHPEPPTISPGCTTWGPGRLGSTAATVRNGVLKRVYTRRQAGVARPEEESPGPTAKEGRCEGKRNDITVGIIGNDQEGLP